MESGKKTSKVKKFYILLIMLVILLIPIAFLSSVVYERQDYKKEAEDFIKNSWGSNQTISAPRLYYTVKTKEGTETKELELNNFEAKIKIQTEQRKKGIFKIPVYTANIELTGDFINNEKLSRNLTLEFKVTDSKGFTKQPQIKFLTNDYTINTKNILTKNVSAKQKIIPFGIKYVIRGTNEIYAEPKGINNKITIEGNWKNPSFEGNFLPDKKTMDNTHFNAEWQIPSIATSSIYEPKAGVSLLIPVDNYKMSIRAVKYAFLFLSLTFLSFFIFEMTTKNNKPVHQLQYLIMGGAMLVYYLLLVSLSEFISFAVSYIIASIMTIGLIGLYTYFVIVKKEDKKFPLTISCIMAFLYTFLYVLLALTDYSLIVGSIGLFIITALIMYSTRKIEWFND